jgi:N-acetylated-alpha-linked acidic dipeptidase
MRRIAILGNLLVLVLSLVVPARGDVELLQGFTRDSSAREHQWEEKFRALPSPERQRDYMQRLTARPHHVGSAFDQDNAEWILSKFKEWGWDAHIETFDVLFPTPKERLVEMIEPTRFAAKLEEPPVPHDPTSNQKSEQ